MAAKPIDKVLAQAAQAGAAGTLIQLQLTVPASEAPRAHTLVAVHQVLGRADGQLASYSCTQQAPPAPRPSHRCVGAGWPATAYLAGATVLTLPGTVVDVWGTYGHSHGQGS